VHEGKQMTSTQPASTESSESTKRDAVLDWLRFSWPGVILGILTGIWAIKVHKVLKDETDILLGTADADVAILAIVLAAVALMSSFLQGRFSRLFRQRRRLNNFFRPFAIVTAVSASASLVSFLGAMNAESGAEWWRAAVFGFAIGLTVWTIVGVASLTFLFIDYSKKERTLTPADNDGGTVIIRGGTVNIINEHAVKPADEQPTDQGS
jgi:type IV secretory pathway TrbD component